MNHKYMLSFNRDAGLGEGGWVDIWELYENGANKHICMYIGIKSDQKHLLWDKVRTLLDEFNLALLGVKSDKLYNTGEVMDE